MTPKLITRLLCGFVPAIEATHLLQGKPPGTYLIRFSKTHLGSFAVTFVDSRGKIKHCLLYSVQPAGVTLKNPPQVYPSLMHFASSHANKLKFPLGTKWSEEASDSCPRLQHPPQPTPAALSTPPNGQGGHSPSPTRKHGDDGWGLPVTPHEDLCSVCLDNPPETVFLECGMLHPYIYFILIVPLANLLSLFLSPIAFLLFQATLVSASSSPNHQTHFLVSDYLSPLFSPYSLLQKMFR